MTLASILIADNDYEIVKLVAESLADEGYEVLRAYNDIEVFRELYEAKHKVQAAKYGLSHISDLYLYTSSILSDICIIGYKIKL